MSKQGGRNYLLPSLPPQFRQSQDIRISSDASIFCKALTYHAKKRGITGVITLIKTNYNNVNIRDARKAILSDIACKSSISEKPFQTIRPAGWSKDYHNLSMNQKYWLDPKRAELDGEDDFKTARESEDWRSAIEVDFANWLQGIAKMDLAFAHDFADRYKEWKVKWKLKSKALRLGKGEVVMSFIYPSLECVGYLWLVVLRLTMPMPFQAHSLMDFLRLQALQGRFMHLSRKISQVDGAKYLP